MALSRERQSCLELGEITVEPAIGVVLLKRALKHVHDQAVTYCRRRQDGGNLATRHTPIFK